MVKDDNYYTVFYWFVSDLGLKGAELPIFAIIYAFSQDEVNCFAGSQSYLAEFAGVSRPTANIALNNLVKKGYIVKEIKSEGITYRVDFENIKGVRNSNKGCKKIEQGVLENRTKGVRNSNKGCKKIEHNNKPYIDIDNKDNTTSMCVKVVDYWNSTLEHTPVKSVSRITPKSKRYEGINARCKQYGFDEVCRAIDNITNSDFLVGKNNRGWTISFDWFIKPNNFVKVLDGNYENSKATQGYCDY